MVAANEAATMSERLGISVVVLLALVVYLIFSWKTSLESAKRISTTSAHEGDGFAAHINCDPNVDHWIAGCLSCSCGCDWKLREKGWCR